MAILEENRPFLTGVIEGFYGRSWSHEVRLQYATFMAQLGFSLFLHCPKNDPYLRKRWTEHWPKALWQQLLQLSEHYRAHGVGWGVGLSPFALYQCYGEVEQAQLHNKIEQLNELRAPVLAILFDDMPGEMPELAARQAQIMRDVRRFSTADRLLMCPTYYSFDPVLETHFGAMPEHYWSQLGAELASDVDVFWTGNRVCSEHITAADILKINSQLGRRVMLWDNYPVNDGAHRSNFLYIAPLAERSPKLAGLLSGHLCNPMNQALLSLPALQGLQSLYLTGTYDTAALDDVLGAATHKQLQCDALDFASLGLSGMGAQRCNSLAVDYARLPGAAAAEVAAWLRGEYTFDPACLTD